MGLKTLAAIASPLAAWLDGLDILDERTEDHAANTTRFLVLCRDGEPGAGGKRSVVFPAPSRSCSISWARRTTTSWCPR